MASVPNQGNGAGDYRYLGVQNSTQAAKFITFPYISTVVTQHIFIAPTRLRLAAIWGVPRVAGSGGACTFSFYKTKDAVAVASGTILHSGTYDLVGTADTNQYLTLVTDLSTLSFLPGDRLGVALTGTATSAVGAITFQFEPTN